MTSFTGNSTRPPATGSRPPAVADRRGERFSPEMTSPDPGTERVPEGKAELEARVEAANAHLAALNNQLTFRVHDDSGQIMVQVVNRNTGEVVNERPPAAFLDLVVRMQEMFGAFFDELT